MARMTHDNTAPRGFLDTGWARLLALSLAVLLAWSFVQIWGDEAARLIEGAPPAIPIVDQPTVPAAVNAALQACLNDRVGDVESMRADGVIDEAQYTAFRQRAEDLCYAQNAQQR